MFIDQDPTTPTSTTTTTTTTAENATNYTFTDSTTDDADTTSYGQNVDTEPPILAPNSPEYKLAVCTMNTFENMIASKCGTWSQKRNCVAALDDVQKQRYEHRLKELMSCHGPTCHPQVETPC